MSMALVWVSRSRGSRLSPGHVRARSLKREPQLANQRLEIATC
jgi:hypothetical protein